MVDFTITHTVERARLGNLASGDGAFASSSSIVLLCGRSRAKFASTATYRDSEIPPTGELLRKNLKRRAKVNVDFPSQ